MNIYVATSWKNDYQPKIVAKLRAVGHEAYDFRHPAPGYDGFSWTDTGVSERPSEEWDFFEYQAALASPVGKLGYAYDIAALERCDAAIFVYPAGRSASFEIGYAVGQKKPCLVVIPEGERMGPELMFSECAFAESEGAMLAWALATHVRLGFPSTAVTTREAPLCLFQISPLTICVKGLNHPGDHSPNISTASVGALEGLLTGQWPGRIMPGRRPL